jgi:hypothetical protein
MIYGVRSGTQDTLSYHSQGIGAEGQEAVAGRNAAGTEDLLFASGHFYRNAIPPPPFQGSSVLEWTTIGKGTKQTETCGSTAILARLIRSFRFSSCKDMGELRRLEVQYSQNRWFDGVAINSKYEFATRVDAQRHRRRCR